MADEKTPILVNKPTNELKLHVMIDDKEDKNNQFYPHNPFAEVHDNNFWDKVESKKKDEGLSFSEALMKTRLDYLRKKADDAGKSDVMLHLFDIYEEFHNIAESKDELEMMPAFVEQLSSFVEALIEEDNKKAKKKPHYSKPLEISDTVDMTVLHLAAKHNLTSIIEVVLKYYPKQCYRKCMCGGPKQQKPVELALQHFRDDAAALLMTQMEKDEREAIHSLFHYDESDEENLFDFNVYLKHPNMKKTVIKVLDSLINPDFPFYPKKKDYVADWSLPNVKPQRYHVSFRVLDGDQMGRPGQHPLFDHNSRSGLYNIAHCSYSKDIIKHPAVRLLTQRKWECFGKTKIGISIALHVFHLVCMTLAFFLKHSNGNRAKYESNSDHARGFFEAITFAMACHYAIQEIVEMIKEKGDYLSNWKTNVPDWIGIGLIISLLPIKFLTVDHSGKNPSEIEWYMSSVTYLVNVFRLFKWFPVIRYIGVHAILIKRLFLKDIPQFLIVYLVVAASFLGSVVLALRATQDGFSKAGFGAWYPVLAEVRALTETNGFSDEYIGKFRIGVIVLLMLNMLCCILIMANILIAHLSNVYTDACALAHVQCDVARAALITTHENSWFKSMSPRRKHYVDGIYVEDVRAVEKMIEEWELQNK